MLFDKLKKLNSIPMHMPGHKRNTALLGDKLPYDIDITEINGFDNLHSPEGILKSLNDKINSIYNAKESFALVNGSTVGIIAAVSALVKQGDTVLVARNCHKSVYNAVALAKANVNYIQPDFDKYGIAKAISPESVKNALTSDTKLLILTSPTYEGVESDIDKICEIAHNNNTLVLLDAAHGAHLFDSYHSADIVIRSLHKSLPALTQCAVANIYGDRADAKAFAVMLSVFETSSPSYVLLASIDECCDFILNNKSLFDEYYERLNRFYSETRPEKLRLLRFYDSGKLVVFTGCTDILGFKLADILRNEYNIEVEWANKDYILCVTSVCDTQKTFDSFSKAITEIDSELNNKDFTLNIISELPKKVREAYETGETESYNLIDCIGKVSAEYIWAYPPGIPLIVPGEELSREIIEFFKSDTETSFCSTFGEFPEKIRCQH